MVKDAAVYELHEAGVAVTGSGTASTDGWQTVCKLEAAKLKDRDYFVFCYGYCGNAGGYVAPSRGFKHIEIGLRKGGGSYVVSYHVQDPGHLAYFWTPSDKDRGMPFAFGFDVDFTGGAGDLEIVARYKYDIEQPQANENFIVERPAILAIDRTSVSEEATMIDFSLANGASASMPRQNEAVLTRHTVNGGPTDGGEYLVIHGANISNADPSNAARVWLDDGASTRWIDPGLGFSRIGRATSSAHWNVQAAILTLPHNFVLRQQHQHSTRNTPNSTVNDSFVYAVKLHADQNATVTTYAPANAFWGPRHIGQFVETSLGLATSQLWLGLSAVVDESKAAHTGQLEINGGTLNAHHIHVLPGPGNRSNMHSLWTAGTLAIVPGVYNVRALGVRNPYDALKYTPNVNAPWLQIFSLSLQIGPLAAGVDENVGADLVIIPDRESTIAVGSLQTLPTEPSYVLPISEGDDLRELLIPRGDRIVSPRFLKGRRIFELVWRGLDTTTGEALSDFFDGLLDTDGGNFAWQAPGDTSAKAYTMEGQAHSVERRSAGTMLLTARVVELVFVVT